MSSKSPRPLAPATLAVQGPIEPQSRAPAIVQPLAQSVSLLQDVGSAEGLRFPRYGNVPMAESVQRRIATLEGAEAACLLSSGMGATSCALLALLRPGDHLLCSTWVYGGTRQLLAQEFGAFGIQVSLVDPMETRVWRKRMRKETRAIFLESPVNPTCRVLDLRPVSYIAQELAVPSERRIRIDGEIKALKLDVRVYTYKGSPLLTAARVYQGQTTNFRTPGGGFAPVFVT